MSRRGRDKEEETDKFSPEPYEGLLDRGVATVGLASLDTEDKAAQKQLREALSATEYWDVPKDAFVLTGPMYGGPECKIRTVTQRGFWDVDSLLNWAEAKYRVYRYEVNANLGFWRLHVKLLEDKTREGGK